MIVSKDWVEEIEMDLVGLCNLSCPLCTRNYAHANHMLTKNVRHIDEIIKQLDEYTNLQRFFIAGAVSEPTMYKYFLEFIQYLNSRNIYYEIFTNGNTHKPDWWEKLGQLVPEKCMCAFTICGSNQQMHEKYRVGSDLQEILDHAAAFRKNNKRNDWIQTIRFEYNQDDLISSEMQLIYDQFSNVMQVDSEGVRRRNDYNEVFVSDIRPIDSRDKLIKQIFANRPRPDDGNKYTIQCNSLKNKKIYINQYGQVSSCYIHAENEQDYFDGEMDYTDILNFKYPDCFVCEKRTRTFIEKMGLEFIC
jgi:organic radical activating enzyme